MPSRLQQLTFGPFTKGVIDRANPDQQLVGAVRSAVGLAYSGANRLAVRPGTRTVLTLKDDAGSPANVTSVCAVVPFADGALAVAHSTNTNKAYLYRLTATMDGWYDVTGALQATASPQPVAVLWTSITTAPDVTIAEGLGVAYIAHAAAMTASSFFFATRQYNPSGTTIACTSLTSAAGVATYTATAPHGLVTGDLVTVSGAVEAPYNVTRIAVTVTGTTTFTYTVAGGPASPATGTPVASAVIVKVTSDCDANGTAEDLYFSGVVAFQQHCWAWGFGGGTVASTAYRPEIARFSQPSFATAGGLFLASDSLTLGNRVRSTREQIVGGFVAGTALYLGGPYLLTRIVGFGRASWFKESLDDQYGFVGPKCAVAVGGTLYYWSPNGPCRVQEEQGVEPLFVPVAAFVASVVNRQYVIAGYDEQTQTVMFACDTGSGVRTRIAFDVARNVWLGPTDDFGLELRNIGSVTPLYLSTAASTTGPAGAPTTATTTSIGVSSAVAGWTPGDITSPSIVSWRVQGTSPWTVSPTLSAGIASYTISGLSAATSYEWRVVHLKDGIYSAYLGPAAATQFVSQTSATPLNPPANPAATETGHGVGFGLVQVSWTNSGESGVSTEIWRAGPSAGAPAAGAYGLTSTAAIGVSSANYGIAASTGVYTYWYKMRHTKSGYTASAYTSAAPVDVYID